MTIIGDLSLMFVNREMWIEQALCREVDPECFFPNKGEVSKAAAAKRVCGLCDVREECLSYAMKRPENWGVWGGLSPTERNRLEWTA